MALKVTDALMQLAQRSFKIDAATIRPDTPLNAVGDSLDMVDFLSEIESEFGIDIRDADLVDVLTVGQLAGVVERLCADEQGQVRARA